MVDRERGGGEVFSAIPFHFFPPNLFLQLTPPFPPIPPISPAYLFLKMIDLSEANCRFVWKSLLVS